METRRLRKRVRGLPAESPPEWLPDGWTVEVRNTRHGKYTYYRSQASGCTFQSKEELLRHLSAVKHDGSTSGRTSRSNESKNQLVEEMKESLELLPSGWIMEIKTGKSGKTAGKTCKSPDSAEKWKSQSTGKKHHLIEEILDSNGELSETATVPNGLPQPPSPENVKVKPEDEHASESASLNPPPSPRNPRERTPKNCAGESNISKEKVSMESEDNLSLETVTEKPSPPSDQTLMATQSYDGKNLEDEAKKEREIKPEFEENSKEEDEILLPQVENAAQKFSQVSNEPSDHLLGDELKLVMENQKTSAEKGSLLDPQNKKNLSEVEMELPVPVAVKNPSTPDLVKPKHGSRKTKATNAATSAPQLSSSRRFACVETDQAVDVDMGGERPHELKTERKIMDSIEELPRSQNEEEGARNTAESLQSQNSFEGGGAIIDWPDFSSASLFGESWPDPCLEFAFRTLTGDLPVLDDAIGIQEYFQQNLFLVEGSKSPDVLLPVSNNKIDDAPASEEVGIKLNGEQDLLGRSESGVMEKK